MDRFFAVLLGAGIIAPMTNVAEAQTRVASRAKVHVTARNDGGAAGHCALVFQIRNVGTTRLSVFAAEIDATDMRTGTPLTVPTTTIPFLDVEPGQSKEFTMASAQGARREHVRHQVTGVTCMTRCESVAWTQRGLGAFEARL